MKDFSIWVRLLGETVYLKTISGLNIVSVQSEVADKLLNEELEIYPGLVVTREKDKVAVIKMKTCELLIVEEKAVHAELAYIKTVLALKS